MKKSTNNQVQQFIEDIQLTDFDKFETLMKLRDSVFSINPKVQEKIMYGGIIFFLETDWGGLFVRKNHISFEFSLGVEFKDPDGLLEGKGKFRRHLKILNSTDIETKNVAHFVTEALSLVEVK